MADDVMNQGYTSAGEPTEAPLSTKNSMAGALHGSAHVWIWRLRAGSLEILIQRRAAEKRTWPNKWDISAAGHMDFGETPLNAAIRETAEEIGLAMNPELLNLLFVHRKYMVSDANPPTVENEFQFVYGYRLDSDEDFVLERDEVGETMWVTKDKFEELTTSNEFVPHGKAYFAELLYQLSEENAGRA